MNFKVKSLFSVGLLALLGFMLGTPKAHADEFTFSFSNTISGTPGTVTGTITLPGTLNFTGAATGVALTSYPAAFNTIIPGSPPIELLNGPNVETFADTFTETGGVLTTVTYDAIYGAPIFALSPSLGFELALNYTGVSILDAQNNGPTPLEPPYPLRATTECSGGLSCDSFTNITAAPDPPSIDLMLIGLVALGTLAAVSKRKPLGQSLVS